MKKSQGQIRKTKAKLIAFCLFITTSHFTVLGNQFVMERAYARVDTEGFYRDDAWLDVDDDKLVLLNDNEIIAAEFDKSNRKKIQIAFQSDATQDELIQLINEKKITRMM